MALKDLITGGQEVEEARRTIHSIKSTNHAPSYGQAQELEKAQTMLWKWRAKIGGAVSLALTAAALATQLSKEEEPVQEVRPQPALVESPAPKISDIEAKTDEVIPKLEAGFEKLEKTLRPKIEAVQDEGLRNELLGPFELVRLNKDFEGKNGPRYHREQSAKGLKSAELSNPYFFGYRVEELEGNVAASFRPATKSMILDTSIDLNNLMDFLIFYHELRHVAQNTNILQAIGSETEWKEYSDFFMARSHQGKRRIEILHEGSAYAYEVEMLNLVLDGELQRTISAQEPIDLETIQVKLNARPDQIGTIQLIVELAKAYYPEALSKGGLTSRFLERTAELHKQNGYEVFIKTEQGYVPFRP